MVGNTSSPMFPKELEKYTTRTEGKKGEIKANLLVNYGWHWDLCNLSQGDNLKKDDIHKNIQSNEISRLDLIIRWGGRNRLSGFLPVQSIYADFYTIDDYWPDFKNNHINDAINWYDKQDITLGG